MRNNRYIEHNKILNLNKSKFIDTMKLNDANIYLNNDDLYVIKIDNNYTMWRGYNNVSCPYLLIPPGSIGDRFKYEPVWYGPPEVTVIYTVREMTHILMRSYPNFTEINENLNLDQALEQYKHILHSGNSAIVAYSLKNECELVDVNNIHNLKKLIEKFEVNWSIENFKRLNELKRITSRQKKRIYEWIQAFVIKNENNNIILINNFDELDPNAQNTQLDNFFELIHNDNNILIEYLKQSIIHNFRKVFGFGDYYDYNSTKKKLMSRKIKNYSIVTVSKDIHAPERCARYDNILSLRQNSINIFNSKQYQDIINEDKYKKINNYVAKKNDVLNRIVNNASNAISEYIIREKTSLPRNALSESFDNININSLRIINSIKNREISGYAFDLNNLGSVGFEEINTNNKTVFKLHIYYNVNNINENKYINYSESNHLLKNGKQCKLCRISHKRNWLNELINKDLSHSEGLVDNQAYYEYNPFSKNIMQVSTAFDNIHNKSYISDRERRILAIPHAHMGTMFDHEDCKIGSTNFPPNGAYGKTYSCGAYIYSNTDNKLEVIFNMIATLNAAKMYAYKKYNKKFKVADINYDEFKGKFYNFKTPIREGSENSQIYVGFHCKHNSEPHLHMHTYIDSNGTNLYDLLELGRLQYDNNRSFMSRASGELFGSPDFSIYNGDHNKLIKEGNRKKTEGDKPYVTLEETPWKDALGMNSISKMHFSCSYEYLFKKIIGIDDNHILMKHKIIFPEPLYEYQPELFKEKDLYSYAESYNNASIEIEKKFSEKTSDLLNRYKKIYIEYKKYTHSKGNKIGTITTKYGEKKDESCIVRQSTTESDAIMVLFLQFATINNTSIGGYFGSAAPLMNNRKNITHTEVCLYNLVDYPVSIVKNTPYTTCFNTINNNIDNIDQVFTNKNILVNCAVCILYVLYFKQHQKKYMINGLNISKINLIDNFLNSDNQNFEYNILDNNDYNDDNGIGDTDFDYYGDNHFINNNMYGGDVAIDNHHDTTKQQKHVCKQQNIVKKQTHKKYKIKNLGNNKKNNLGNNKINNLGNNIFTYLFEISNIDSIIEEFNNKTKIYTLDDQAKNIVKNTLLSLYYNQVPTNNHYNSFYKKN